MPEPRTRRVTIRLTEEQFRWLKLRVATTDESVQHIITRLIDRERQGVPA